MKLCGDDAIEIEPGAVTRWELAATADSLPVDVPPSENEKFHLDAVRRNGTAGWLALTVEFAEAVAVDDITRSLRKLVDRHEVLRCHFVSSDDEHVRHRLPVGDLTVRPVPGVVVPDGPGPEGTTDPGTTDPGTGDSPLADRLVDDIATVCSPFAPLQHYLAAVQRPSSTTVILAFDHCYVDAYSLAVIASELVDDLSGTKVAQPMSFLDIRTVEDAAPTVAPDDPRLRGWGEFLAANHWTVPEFPLDLGLAPGDTAPVCTEVRTLMCAESARRFEQTVHALNARTYPALLTAFADAVHDVGGPAELPAILPVHTRYDAADRKAVGWLVGNAPIRLSARGDRGTTLRANTARLGEALPLARIGLTPVYMTYGDLIRTNRSDVFMVSYVDYRKLGLPASVTTRQISSSRRTDTAQFWFWRDADGVHLRARYPDTELAHRTMTGVLDAVDDRLRDVWSGGLRHRAG